MLVAVSLQIVSILVLAGLAWMAFSPLHAASLMVGGLAAALPNALFAARLALNRGRSAHAYPVVFFIGQFMKIGLTIGLLGVAVAWADVWHWPALILGLIVALKVPLFALWLSGDKTPYAAPVETAVEPPVR